MKRFVKWTVSLLGLAVSLLLLCFPVSAHPVDVYVQASYVTLTEDQILLDIDLTPGVVIGEAVLADIDTDADNIISAEEGAAYAAHVVAAIHLQADSQPLQLTLLDVQYPEPATLAEGLYPIQLHLTAPLPDTRVGEYQLFYENAFSPAGYISSYVVNGFVQADAQERVDITNQQRDWDQKTITLSYTILITQTPALPSQALQTIISWLRQLIPSQ